MYGVSEIKAKNNTIFIPSYKKLGENTISIVLHEKQLHPSNLIKLKYEEVKKTLTNTLGAFKQNLKNKRMEELIRNSILSIKPFDVEITIKEKKSRNSYQYPYPNNTAKLTGIKENGNPKIPKKVYQFEEEKIAVVDALKELGEYDIYYIQKILSAGVLGIKKTIIPTKNAITAADETLSNIYKEKIKMFKTINDYLLFHTEVLHNRYTIIMLPSSLKFENYESWETTHDFKTTREDDKKKTYSEQKGGYYASKFSIFKFLKNIKRQAHVIVIREVRKTYKSLGVWQVREGVKLALTNSIGKYESLKELLEDANKLTLKPIKTYLKYKQLNIKKFL